MDDEEKISAENLVREAEENEDKEKIKKKIGKMQNKQVMFAVLLMSLFILAIIFVPIIKKNTVDSFKYINLKFQKTQMGDIKFYSTKIPITNIQGQLVGDYSINFRNDPRELENISVTVWENTVAFNRENITYITLYPEMEICEDNAIAMFNLAGFLRDFGGLEVKSAISKKDIAEENKVPYVTCKNSPNNTVIYVNSGSESRIRKVNDNCYELIYDNCEILQVSEKFMMIILKKYMSYFNEDVNKDLYQ